MKILVFIVEIILASVGKDRHLGLSWQNISKFHDCPVEIGKKKKKKKYFLLNHTFRMSAMRGNLILIVIKKDADQ